MSRRQVILRQTDVDGVEGIRSDVLELISPAGLAYWSRCDVGDCGGVVEVCERIFTAVSIPHVPGYDLEHLDDCLADLSWLHLPLGERMGPPEQELFALELHGLAMLADRFLKDDLIATIQGSAASLDSDTPDPERDFTGHVAFILVE